jgi:hypothetical protein
MGQFGGAPGSARHIISKIFSPRIGVPYTSACTTKHFPSPDARQRSRLFAPRNPRLRHIPNSNWLCLDCQRLFPSNSISLVIRLRLHARLAPSTRRGFDST